MPRIRGRSGTPVNLYPPLVKLLLDQNVSHRLVGRLSNLYPGSTHVRSVSLHEAEDSEVWQYALDNDLTIVTKDSDFHIRSILDGHPPKVIWITRGNCTTDDIESILRGFRQQLIAFSDNPSTSEIS